MIAQLPFSSKIHQSGISRTVTPCIAAMIKSYRGMFYKNWDML